MNGDEADAVAWTDEWMFANTEVYLALRNLRENPAAAIVDFLRTDVPIHPILRDALADAFEHCGPDGTVRFEVRGIPHGPATPGGRRRQLRDIAIADFVAERRSAGISRSEAEREASTEFTVGQDQCHKAVTEVGKMRKWIAAHMPPSAPEGAHLPPDIWEALAQQRYLMHLAGET